MKYTIADLIPYTDFTVTFDVLVAGAVHWSDPVSHQITTLAAGERSASRPTPATATNSMDVGCIKTIC